MVFSLFCVGMGVDAVLDDHTCAAVWIFACLGVVGLLPSAHIAGLVPFVERLYNDAMGVGASR